MNKESLFEKLNPVNTSTNTIEDENRKDLKENNNRTKSFIEVMVKCNRLPDLNIAQNDINMIEEMNKEKRNELNESKIDISMIINKSCYEVLKHKFSCKLCNYLLFRPMMCSICENLFCYDCVSKYKQDNVADGNTNPKCIFGCNSFVEKEISVGIGGFLNELKIKCKYNCEVPFSTYSKHVKDCEKYHKSDIICWNCSKVSHKNKMKQIITDNIEEVKTSNTQNKIVLMLSQQEILSSKHESEYYKEILNLDRLIHGVNNQIYAYQVKLKAKETIKYQIDRLERLLKEGEDILDINAHLIKLKNDKEAYIKLKEEFKANKQNSKDLNDFRAEHYLIKQKQIMGKESVIGQSLAGHNGDIRAIINISDSIIASSSEDKTIKIWDINSLECTRTLTGHKACVNSLIYLCKNRIVSASYDKTIRIWNVENNTCEKELCGHNDWVRSLLRLNEKSIVSGGDDKAIKIWDIETGKCISTLIGHENLITSLINVNDQYIASGSVDSLIKVWDINNFTCSITLKGHIGRVYSLIKLNDYEIASCSEDKTIKIWNLRTKECDRSLFGHNKCIFTLLKLGENQIISGGDEGILKIWDTLSTVCLKTINAHDTAIYTLIKIADSVVVSGGEDKSIKLWHL